MKLFRLGNTSSSWWVFAHDLEDALDISMTHTSTRKRENIGLIYERDVPTEFHRGIGSKVVKSHTFDQLLKELKSGVQKSEEELLKENHESKYKGWQARLNGEVRQQPYDPTYNWLD